MPVKYHYKRKSKNDQFYTRESIAKDQLDIVIKKYGKENYFLEPSAGTGAFLKPLKKYKARFKAFDLEPKYKDIVKGNFLETSLKEQNYITIGNPPFGKNSSVAIKFFNKCAENSSVIAFILPKTFRKISVAEKLNRSFHLVYDKDLAKNSFVFNGQDFDVPSCFQIWEKKKTLRELVRVQNEYIDFVSPEESDFCVRRVGGRAGSVLEDKNYSLSSTYFIKEKLKDVKKIIKNIDFSKTVNNTAGVRSLSKKELILAIHHELCSQQTL